MLTLTRLHYAITIDVLMRVSLVLTAGMLLALTARRNAALRHAILVAGLAAAFLVPAAMLTMRVLPVSALPLDWLGRIGLDDVAVVRSRPSSELQHHSARLDHPAPTILSSRVEPRARNGLNVAEGRFLAVALLSALVLGAIVKVTGLGFSLLRLRQIVARARPVADDPVLSLLELIQRRIPMRRPPRLLESADVSAPVAAGVIGDYVLLPTGWAGSLCQDEMLAILCHESAHLARRDHYVVILQELLASALWFHPLVHLFNRILNRVREEVCDNHAIAMVERLAYCEALLHLAVGRPGTFTRGATSMWSRHWPLEDRIRGILDEQRPTRTKISGVARSATAVIAVAVCGLVAMPQVGASRPDDRIEKVLKAGPSPQSGAGQVANLLTRKIVKSFPANGKKPLRLENLAGRIELVPSGGTTIEVDATIRVGDLRAEDVGRLVNAIGWVEVPTDEGVSRWGLSFPSDQYPKVRYPVAGEFKADFETIRYLDHEVGISAERGQSIPSVEFDLRISLPPKTHLELHNAVGPVESNAVASALRLATRHGVIKLDDVRAPIDATSEFGDVLISPLDANAVVRTGTGAIDLSRMTRGQVDLSTRSGHCRITQLSDAGFNLNYSGARPLDVLGKAVNRISFESDDRSRELLSRGTGGPSITVNGGSGNTVIEAGP